MEVVITRINKSDQFIHLPPEYEMTPTVEAYSALGNKVMKIIAKEGELDNLIFVVEYDDKHYRTGERPIRRKMVYVFSTEKDPVLAFED